MCGRNYNFAVRTVILWLNGYFYGYSRFIKIKNYAVEITNFTLKIANFAVKWALLRLIAVIEITNFAAEIADFVVRTVILR